MPFFPTHINNLSVKPLVEDEIAIETNYYSPALSLERHLIQNPPSTFYAEVEEREGDILIIDKSIEPSNGATVVAFIDGGFVLKTLVIENDVLYLASDNAAHIKVDEQNSIFGTVRYYISKL